MYVCVFVCIYMHMYVYTYIYIDTYLYEWTLVVLPSSFQCPAWSAFIILWISVSTWFGFFRLRVFCDYYAYTMYMYVSTVVFWDVNPNAPDVWSVEMYTWCTPGVWPVERANVFCICMYCREEIMALSLGYCQILWRTLSVSSQKYKYMWIK